jgi:hypothetical protein
MAKKAKSKNPFTSWFYNRNLFQNPIAKRYRKNVINILSNSLYRIIFSVVALIAIVVSLSLFIIYIPRITNWISQLILFGFFVALIYLPAKYFYINLNQITSEISLNFSISNLKWTISFLRKKPESKHYRSLQAKMNRLRTDIFDFLEYSEILSPPIFNYELNRLQKRIDVFFNSSSEALVPINKLFSRAEEFQEETAIERYYDRPLSPEEEKMEIEDQRMKEYMGEIDHFDLMAMDYFLNHLWDTLFEKETTRYSIFSFKHPVNLTTLSMFFEHWNSIIASHPNSKAIYEKARKDIEEYYKSIGELERERRQSRWKLRDNVLVVLISVGLSTLIQYLISIA